MARGNNGRGTFIFGLLLGGVVGAVIGTMLAPKSGSETRHEIQHRSEVWRTRAEEMAANLSGQVSPAIGNARERVTTAGQNVRERVEPAIENARGRVSQATSRVRRGDNAGDDEAPLDEHATNGTSA